MTWTVEWQAAAVKALQKIDKQTQKRLINFVDETLVGTDNPRRLGKPLVGEHKGLWRYRVGDYRLICQLRDKHLSIVMVNIGHRKDIYD